MNDMVVTGRLGIVVVIVGVSVSVGRGIGRHIGDALVLVMIRERFRHQIVADQTG
jgi:uncharacterized membrane protein YczE